MSCECNSQNFYWKVDTSGDKQVIVGTTRKSEASIFYIEKQPRPCVFNIAHYGEQVQSSARKTSSKYVIRSSRLKGEDDGPLQIEGKKAAYCVLQHPIKKRDELSVDYWETDSCYIRLAPRKVQKKSYIAFDGIANKTMYVHSSEKEGKNIAMRFRLSRIGIEQLRSRAISLGCEHGSEYNSDSNTLTRVRAPGRMESDGAEEDEEYSITQLEENCGEGGGLFQEEGGSEDSEEELSDYWQWESDED